MTRHHTGRTPGHGPRWATRYRDRQEKENTGFSRSRRLLAQASQVLRKEVMVATQAETREGGRLRLIIDTLTRAS